MSIIYAVAVGHDVAEGSLVSFDPQPFCQGIEYTRRMPSASGLVWDEGPHVWFLFEMLYGDEDYVSLMTMFGLVLSKTSLVTVRVRNEFLQPQIVNGVAVRPQVGKNLQRQATFPAVRLLVKDLEEVT